MDINRTLFNKHFRWDVSARGAYRSDTPSIPDAWDRLVSLTVLSTIDSLDAGKSEMLYPCKGVQVGTMLLLSSF